MVVPGTARRGHQCRLAAECSRSQSVEKRRMDVHSNAMMLGWVRFSTPLSLSCLSSNFGRAHSLLFLVMPSRWSNQQYRGPWSWYGRWEPLNDADQSWTWSSSQKGDGEWKLVTRKRKKWASGTVSRGGKSCSASSDASVDKSAIKAHRTFLEVVLGDSGSQPTKNSEPERQKLAAETTSRIEKLERLIALVGDDESLVGVCGDLGRGMGSVYRRPGRVKNTGGRS